MQVTQQKKKQQKIIAIGGGKGGIGKSIVSSNLSVGLAQDGSKVVLIDADLGGANINSLFGIRYIEKSLEDYLTSEKPLSDFLTPTELDNLKLILGGTPFLGIANPEYPQKLKLFSGLNQLNTDYLVVDLGAGTSYTILDFFNRADLKVVVLSPDITSLQNCYTFVKLAFFRYFYSVICNAGALNIISEKEFKTLSTLDTVDQFFQAVQKKNNELYKIFLTAKHAYSVSIIGNMVSNEKEMNVLWGVYKIINNYLKINPQILGALKKSNLIKDSVNLMRPFVLDGRDVENISNLISIRDSLKKTDNIALNSAKSRMMKMINEFKTKGKVLTEGIKEEELRKTVTADKPANKNQTETPRFQNLDCVIPTRMFIGSHNIQAIISKIDLFAVSIKNLSMTLTPEITNSGKKIISIPVLDEGLVMLPFTFLKEDFEKNLFILKLSDNLSEFQSGGIMRIIGNLIVKGKKG